MSEYCIMIILTTIVAVFFFSREIKKDIHAWILDIQTARHIHQTDMKDRKASWKALIEKPIL